MLSLPAPGISQHLTVSVGAAEIMELVMLFPSRLIDDEAADRPALID